MQNLTQLTESRWKFTGHRITAFITYARHGLAHCFKANTSNGSTQIAGNLETLTKQLVALDKQEQQQ